MAGGFDFSNRTALITGAASGIGAATARWLAAHDISALVLVDRDEAGLAALEINCPVTCYTGDVADEALWDRIECEVPRLDHALLNAGVANGCAIVDQSFAEWRRVLSANLDGMFLSLRASLRIMQRAETKGSLVLTSSAAGIKPVAMTAAYGSSKAAVAHLARLTAAEVAPKGIRVNAIAPGRVDTPIWTTTDRFKALVAEWGEDGARSTGSPRRTSLRDKSASCCRTRR